MPTLKTISSEVNRRIMEMMVFPIIKALYYPDGTQIHKLVGTGFFLNSKGFFLSARHVFQGRDSVFDLEGAKSFAVYCVHSVHIKGKPVARYIDVSSIKTRKDTDIAAGYVEMNQFGKGDNSVTEKEMRNTAYFNHATTLDIQVGTEIWTVAYPLAVVNHSEEEGVHIYSKSDMYQGKITRHYPLRRDSSLLTWPCYETDMEIKRGASGGPVFISGSGGVAFAINCTGTDPHCVSHVSSLVPLVSHLSNPDNTAALNNWGNALNRSGKHGEALEKFKTAATLNPDYIEALNNCGISLFGLGKPKEAIEKFEKAVALNPDDTAALNNWGNALKYLGKHEEAIEKYEKVVALNPDHAEALYNWGNALFGLGKPKEAIEKFKKALALNPDHTGALNNCGSALFGLGKYEEAIEKFKKTLALNPDHPDALNNCGGALVGLGKYEEAIEKFEKVLALNPDNSAALNNLGISLKKLGRFEEAEQKFIKAKGNKFITKVST